MSAALYIGTPAAAHIRWVPWNKYREAVLKAFIEEGLKRWEWNDKKRAAKNELQNPK